MKKLIKVLMTSLCMIVLMTESAWAYLDPGTGSLILQSLIAGVAGAMVVGRLYWEKLKVYFSSIFSADGSKTSADASNHVNAERDSEPR